MIVVHHHRTRIGGHAVRRSNLQNQIIEIDGAATKILDVEQRRAVTVELSRFEAIIGN